MEVLCCVVFFDALWTEWVDLLGDSVVVLFHPVSAVVVLKPGGGKPGDSVVVVLGAFVGIKARP